jgi:hypothetical protein
MGVSLIFNNKKLNLLLLVITVTLCVSASRILSSQPDRNSHHFSADCNNNLAWIGRSGESFKSENGFYASSIEDLGEIAGWKDVPLCPIGGQSYDYKKQEHGFELHCPVAQELLNAGHSGRLYIYRSEEGLSLKKESK